jgi:hypothetical protein
MGLTGFEEEMFSISPLIPLNDPPDALKTPAIHPISNGT